jgi:hypothetical protein
VPKTNKFLEKRFRKHQASRDLVLESFKFPDYKLEIKNLVKST